MHKITHSNLQLDRGMSCMGGRAHAPSVLIMVRPGADTLLLLFEYDTLGSKWNHWGPIEVKVSEELVVRR